VTRVKGVQNNPHSLAGQERLNYNFIPARSATVLQNQITDDNYSAALATLKSGGYLIPIVA
jgi:hypothetical protein